MLFEISRILEYSGDIKGMKEVILVGMNSVPTEWKLALERIHHFVELEDWYDA